jgi:hypothetical protein
MVEKCIQRYEEYFLLIINLKKLRRGVYTVQPGEKREAQRRISAGGGRAGRGWGTRAGSDTVKSNNTFLHAYKAVRLFIILQSFCC